jgi:hypothetical protein
VEKNQYELCLEILRRFNQAGVLKDIMLMAVGVCRFIGSIFLVLLIHRRSRRGILIFWFLIQEKFMGKRTFLNC